MKSCTTAKKDTPSQSLRYNHRVCRAPLGPSPKPSREASHPLPLAHGVQAAPHRGWEFKGQRTNSTCLRNACQHKCSHRSSSAHKHSHRVQLASNWARGLLHQTHCRSTSQLANTVLYCGSKTQPHVTLVPRHTHQLDCRTKQHTATLQPSCIVQQQLGPHTRLSPRSPKCSSSGASLLGCRPGAPQHDRSYSQLLRSCEPKTISKSHESGRLSVQAHQLEANCHTTGRQPHCRH